jgi:hypothetical protein
MLKLMPIAAVLLVSAGSVQAGEQMSCDEGVLAMVQAAVAAAPESRRERALKELAMAEAAMKAADAGTCSMHLANAMMIAKTQSPQTGLQ